MMLAFHTLRCIVDRHGLLVRLNDRNRSYMLFDAATWAKGRKILRKLNSCYVINGVIGPGPYRLVPVEGPVLAATASEPRLPTR